MSIFVNSEYGKNKLSVKHILTDPVMFLAFGFGSGLVKKMPGTIGTIAAIPVYLLFEQTNSYLYSVLTILVFVIGIRICDVAANQLGEHDFGGIVWDEIAGFLITMWFVPFSWYAVLYEFILFRILDIFKPWPIKWINQKPEGGMGIMLDDVLAGIIAAIILIFVV